MRGDIVNNIYIVIYDILNVLVKIIVPMFSYTFYILKIISKTIIVKVIIHWNNLKKNIIPLKYLHSFSHLKVHYVALVL